MMNDDHSRWSAGPGPSHQGRLSGWLSDEEQAQRSAFCETCLEDSSWGSPGSIIEIGFGKCLYGDTERCAHCDSSVRVLWFVIFFIPVIPLGAYRCRHVHFVGVAERFVARETRLRWKQALVHWGVAALTCAALYIVLRQVLSRSGGAAP